MVQMDNERMRSGNVMSVEIALQREAEYQKRIQNLQKPSDYDSRKIIVPDQVVPSKVVPEESQQKVYSQYEACSGMLIDLVSNKQQKLEHESPVTKREATHLQFQEPSTPIQGSSSLVGMKRKTPENFTCSSPQPEQQSYVPETVNIWCKVCQVPCTSVFNFKQHCQGRKHKSKVEVEELKHLTICNDKKDSGPVWCDICSVPCSDGSAYKQHCDGKKHAAFLKAFNKAMRGK
ncbi:zinc finger RNA-binding protein-like [Papaver somniferum]|uniref:zinc finger RNA-binding protein-like n=1 Tax=Papaver somniferum TaxID=3469 RepID=UPI000E6F5F7C|nr:zinc finger RNA-binding protein-like [Papaver somniferum]